MEPKFLGGAEYLGEGFEGDKLVAFGDTVLVVNPDHPVRMIVDGKLVEVTPTTACNHPDPK